METFWQLQRPASYVFAHIVLGAHQVLHLSPELLVEALQLLFGIQGLLQGSGHGQGSGLLLPGLGLSTIALLGVTSRGGLLLRQQLQEGIEVLLRLHQAYWIGPNVSYST